MEKIIFQLEPLTCPSCIKKIETVLQRTAGVESAKVMFNSSKVKVELNEAEVKVEKLKVTLEKLGYSVLSMKVS
ncbi:heavy metal-associated domain-containing protein [Robertmurraya sp. DFI.2.37]|uniref:heavy-metal-associated domain-containing protein n=1 Tax=Robertmurraya sp. DFI.2.37 TaxID=3031819 RepID=UPI0023DA97EC|nr:heavy metal-associated domain-containing protein [Robertmurraya sp. DFI.2.37]MDF1510358.1 heavy metal-associated domain-containing protein [Robertmurraya sp. DFI.2.37]